METLRVLVVEDSLTIRRHIVSILDGAPGFTVVGEAADGKTAIELCEKHRPDVITMDMVLPLMSGVAATEYIMAHDPRPILIVSASTNRGELFKTYDALAAGAVDVLEKPDGLEPDDGWARQLLSALRVVARVSVIRHPRARLGRIGQGDHPGHAAAVSATPVPGCRVIGIGASTGGPGAVLDILKTLPPDFATPILLVIHISDAFGPALADWFAAQTGRDIRYAHDGERLPPSGRCVVLMAPPGRHLELAGESLRVTAGPERHSCRPSVDVLFESLARHTGRQTVACLLTGMGRDGASGLLAIRKAGGVTIAQDEATSIVFGMPGEAVRLNAALHVLPLGEIAAFVAAAAGHRAPRRERSR